MPETLTKHINKIFLFLFSLGIISLIVNLKKFAYWDEIVFLRGANSLANNIRPIYFSELYQDAKGPWYPSLYFFIIKFIALKFTSIEFGIRLFNLCCYLITLLFLFKSAFLLFKDKFWAYLCICLFVTTPAVLQGVLLIEIDTSLLSLTVTYSVFNILRSIEKHKKITNKVEIATYVLIALSKIFFLPLIFGSLVLYKLLAEKNIKAVLYSAINLIVAILVFLSVWILVCYLNHTNTFYFIEFLRGRTSKQGFFDGAHIQEIFKGLVRKTIWLSFAFLILTTVSTIVFIRYSILERKTSTLLLVIFSIFIVSFLFYVFIGIDAAGYPKYLYPILGISCIMITYLIKDAYPTFEPYLSRKNFQVRLILLILIAVAILVAGGDPIYNSISLKYGRNLVNSAVYIESKKFFIIALAAYWLSFLSFFALFYFNSRKMLPSFVIGMFITLIASNIVLSIYQSRPDRSSLYMYGITGTSETIQFIKKNKLIDDQINVMPSEIAFYINKNYRFYDIDQLMQKGLTQNIFDTINPNVFILRDHNWGDNGRLNILLTVLNSERFKATYCFKQIGGYQIYFKKPKNCSF